MALTVDFSGLADVNPYVNSDFTFIDDDAQIVSGALETITTAGLTRVYYNASQPPSGTISAKVTLDEGPNNGDWVGAAILKSNGEGYVVYSVWTELRIKRINAAGSTSNVSPDADFTNQAVAGGDTIELQYDTATNTLRSYHNGSLLATKTDTLYTQGDASGDFYVGFLFNRLNNGGDGITAFESSSIGGATFAIDSTDASMQRSGTFDVTFSNPATTPTTGNTSLAQGGDTLTCTGVTGSDPYTATFSVGDLTKQVDATGYDWTLTVDAETDTTGNIPLTIQSGYTLVELAGTLDTTNGSLLYGYTGDAPVAGDDLEYDVTSTLDAGVSFSVATDGVWTVTESSPGDWTTDITVDRRVVQADGTIGSTQEITLSAAEPSAPVMPADTSVDVAENATTVGTFAASSGTSPITYTLSGPDAALFSINSSTGAVTFDSAPDYESDPLSYSITVTATNSEGSDSQNITVNVTNVVETPVLASTLALTGTVDSAFSRTLSIQSGDAATSWNVTGGADQGSYSINSSGVLSRTAPNDTAEDEVVTVTATNSAGTSNTQTVTITYSEASYVGTNSIALNIGISI